MEKTTLNIQQFGSALAILERERRTKMSTPREDFYFRIYNYSVWVFTCIYIPYVLILYFYPEFTAWIGNIDLVYLISDYLFWSIALLTIAIVILFFLNLKLVLKLWNQARLRRKLNVDTKLKEIFKYQLPRGESSKVLMIERYFAAFGIIIILFQLFFGFVKNWSFLSESIKTNITSIDLKAIFALIVIFGRLCGPIALGICMTSRYFMRRGKERLEIVDQLQQSLSKHKTAFENSTADKSINIASTDYDLLASLERMQILDDRQLSIQRARKESRESSYVIQKSHKMLDALYTLDSDTRVKVEDEILRLASDPMHQGAIREPQSGTLRIRVPDTTLDITYQIEFDDRRIKIYTLESTTSDLSRPQPVN